EHQRAVAVRVEGAALEVADDVGSVGRGLLDDRVEARAAQLVGDVLRSAGLGGAALLVVDAADAHQPLRELDHALGVDGGRRAAGQVERLSRQLAQSGGENLTSTAVQPPSTYSSEPVTKLAA